MGQNKGTLCHRCAERYGEALFDALNITEIHPRDVILTPALLAPRQP